MSHSPGPWTWGYGKSAVLQSADGHVLFSVEQGQIFNMRPGDNLLIAAAPRMLEMLRKLEWQYDDELGDSYCPTCQAMQPGKVEWAKGHSKDCELAALLEELK